MRKFFSVMAVLGLAAAANAQTLNPAFYDCCDGTDGTFENSWKVNAPTTTGDFFNQRFDSKLVGARIEGLCVTTNVTGGGANDGQVGAYLPNLGLDPTGCTPDLTLPLTQLIGPAGGNKGNPCGNGLTIFDTVDYVQPPGTVHIAHTAAPGDSTLWLCGDTNSATFNGHFTTNSYASPAIPFTANWGLGFATRKGGPQLLVNGASTACVNELDTLCLTFISGCPMPGIALIQVSVFGLPFTTLTPFPLDRNGNFQICAPIPCVMSPVYPINLRFQVFYGDGCDTKPNGASKVKMAGPVTVTIKSNPLCNAGKVCFGLRDDTILDSTIWKVQNPAGSMDWFNVNVNSPGIAEDPSSCTATGIEVASWDFCGSTQSWQNVGLYAGSAADPAGSPDVANPISSVSLGSATMAPNASDWTYPATFYDIADVHLDSTTVYHGAVQWQSGDTCVWIGSDTDGTDDSPDCATVPGTSSYFTLDGYATNGVPFSGANWMIKVDWQ